VCVRECLIERFRVCVCVCERGGARFSNDVAFDQVVRAEAFGRRRSPAKINNQKA